MADCFQTAQPFEPRFVLALPRYLARRTDAPAIGVQPQADQQLRIRMLPPSMALHRSNLRMIQSQFQPAYQFPNRTRPVVLVAQILTIAVPQQHLPAINRNQSRTWRL